MGSQQIIEALSDVMLWRGIPEQIRSDNGPEFIKQLRQWLARTGQSLGERVLREFQWEAAGRMPEWRDLLLVEGGTGGD